MITIDCDEFRAGLTGVSNERVKDSLTLFSDMKRISGLSTKQLSQKLGYSPEQIDSWVSQKEHPPLGAIVKMKRLIRRPLTFIVTPDDFVERTLDYLNKYRRV